MCPTGDPEAGVGEASVSDLPNVQAYDDGPADDATVANDCGLIQCDPTVHDTHHLIVFRDTNWTHDDVDNTLALTTVTYGVNSGTIFDADMEINSSTTSTFPHYLTTMEPPPVNLPANTYDLQAIITHEAGHFFGLAHAVDQTAIMYAFYKPGSIALMPDDIAGICAIYPPESTLPPEGGGSAHKSSCASVPAPAPPFGSAAGMMLGLYLFAWARRRKVK
jgi:hypothetical protein